MKTLLKFKQTQVCHPMAEAQRKPGFIGVSSRGFHAHGQWQGHDARTTNKCFLLLCNPCV